MAVTLDDMMFGRFEGQATSSQRDVRRFYNHINATLKGARRRQRRLVAHILKMLRKGKPPNARYLSRD